MAESFENKSNEAQPQVETSSSFINEQQKAEVRNKIIDIANDEKYKVKNEDEEKWLASLHEELKKSDLLEKYAGERTPSDYGINTLRTDQVGTILKEVEDRIFAALY